MPALETEESAAKRGQGLKILTPSQMLSRLRTSLAQLKAGNNSQEFENEIILCIDEKNYPRQSINT